MPTIRINGVVKFARSVRKQIEQGTHIQNPKAFHQSISNVLQQVEQICQDYQLCPEQLPGPTYQAYRYLKDLDLDHPLQPKTRTTRGNKITAFLHAAVEDIQQQMNQVVSGSINWNDSPILDNINSYLTDFENLRNANGSSNSVKLEDKRRQLWLAYLAEPGAIEMHLQTLTTAVRFIRDSRPKTAWLSNHVGLTAVIQIRLGVITSLYRTEAKNGVVDLTLHEGFSGAPNDIIAALVWAGLGSRRKSEQDLIRRYAKTESFQQIQAKLTPLKALPMNAARGQFFNLNDVFNHVNEHFFDGSLEKPRLHWSASTTYRKFGHYQPTSNTIQVSRTLDRSETPPEVIDFIMYHELLHKKLGAVQTGKRRIAHTREFRAAEMRFPGAGKILAYLNQLSATEQQQAATRPRDSRVNDSRHKK